MDLRMYWIVRNGAFAAALYFAMPYAEQYTAWHLVNAPRIGTLVTLTTIDDVKF